MSKVASYGDFIAKEVGSHNWVVFARRTRRIVEKYGDSVVIITPKRNREIYEKYIKTYGYAPY